MYAMDWVAPAWLRQHALGRTSISWVTSARTEHTSTHPDYQHEAGKVIGGKGKIKRGVLEQVN